MRKYFSVANIRSII